MDELVTIIVPVYNKRAHIERCVNSLMNQTYPNLQIILVDDGSTDGSGDLCDALAGEDTRIELIRQTNRGVSAARNTGLRAVRGAWIAFVDADDYISPYFIEDMLTAAVQGDCDIAISRYVCVPDDMNEDADFQRFSHSEYITGRKGCIQNFGRDTILLNVCWGRLFKAHIWTDLFFPEGKINEDLYLSHAMFYRAKLIAVTDAVLYAYVQSGESIMRSAFTTKRLDVLDAWQEGVRFFTEAGELDLAHIAKRVYCSRVFDALCVCKSMIPHEHEALRQLKQRAIDAYMMAKPIRGYIDCSSGKAFSYRLKLFVGRWFRPLYAFMFARGRTYI